MGNFKKNKNNFTYDDQGRAILGSAKEMADWVKLGFDEQNKSNRLSGNYLKNFIDFRQCVLFVSYPIDRKKSSAQIFNLCDLAGIVSGIEKIEGDSEYLYKVTYDIFFDGSEIFGNFFHYVIFEGMVSMDNIHVRGAFSCFKCLFNGFVNMHNIHLTGGFNIEQCVFRKGLVMNGAVIGNINANFNNCTIKEQLSLDKASLTNQRRADYSQSLSLTNSSVDNLNISRISTDGVPFFVQNTSIHGMKMNNVCLDSLLDFYCCTFDGIITSIVDDDGPKNRVKKLSFHSCKVKAQYHIENADIEKLLLNFCSIDVLGRFRLSQCVIDELLVGSSSVFGQLDIIGNTISLIGLEETCVHGLLNFQSNEIHDYADRQTLRLLKNEAMKVNDNVAATQLYSKEMQSLLTDNSVSSWDKISLRLNKWFSSFGENWAQALCVTFFSSLVLTILMLGFGSTKYRLNFHGEFMGLERFITALLDGINVFSIPLFGDTIKEYGLNVFGQVLYFLIKLLVAYGSYQFIAAFRKHSRS